MMDRRLLLLHACSQPPHACMHAAAARRGSRMATSRCPRMATASRQARQPLMFVPLHMHAAATPPRRAAPALPLCGLTQMMTFLTLLACTAARSAT